MTSIWAGIPWPMFIEMDGEDQSAIVAAYRVHSKIEAIINEEQTKSQKAAARKGSPGKR